MINFAKETLQENEYEIRQLEEIKVMEDMKTQERIKQEEMGRKKKREDELASMELVKQLEADHQYATKLQSEMNESPKYQRQQLSEFVCGTFFDI